MNKKAAAPMLSLCALAFIIAVFLFYINMGWKDPSEGQPQVIGEKQFNLISEYQEAEEITNFLRMSAELSAKDLPRDDLFTSTFETNFAKYIETCNFVYGTNITLDQLNLQYSSTEIVSKAREPLVFEEPEYTYKIYPSFKISI